MEIGKEKQAFAVIAIAGPAKPGRIETPKLEVVPVAERTEERILATA